MSTIFIGDVHGCAQELELLLDEIGYRAGHDRLLLAGDAFSRGPLPLRAWEIICETDAEMVLGNHDDRLLRQLNASLQGEAVEVSGENQRFTLDQLLPAAEPLCRWLRQRPLVLEEADFILVHAGINPELGLKGTTRQEFLTIRTWPPVKGVVGPRWHDVLAPQHIHPLIVFGHDAPGGLVVKRLAEDDDLLPPNILGLDSGCVYGGSLSAYVLEEQRIVQVTSTQPEAY